MSLSPHPFLFTSVVAVLGFQKVAMFDRVCDCVTAYVLCLILIFLFLMRGQKNNSGLRSPDIPHVTKGTSERSPISPLTSSTSLKTNVLLTPCQRECYSTYAIFETGFMLIHPNLNELPTENRGIDFLWITFLYEAWAG